MATHSTGHLDDAALMARPQAELSRLGNKALVPGGIGLVLAAVGFLAGRDTFLQSYLIAYIFWTGITVGSLAVLMVNCAVFGSVRATRMSPSLSSRLRAALFPAGAVGQFAPSIAAKSGSVP